MLTVAAVRVTGRSASDNPGAFIGNDHGCHFSEHAVVHYPNPARSLPHSVEYVQMSAPAAHDPKPIVRAFLSHATVDKPFVSVVAKRLGRQQVHYDQWSFESGKQFITAIREAVAQSSLFVLFASRAALASLWVKFERVYSSAVAAEKPSRVHPLTAQSPGAD